MQLHGSYPEWSHSKLAGVFNQRYGAAGFPVGRTWVGELCKRQAYEALNQRRQCKHRVPEPEPGNHTWGFDTSCVSDGQGLRHIVLGVVDHGSRLNMAPASPWQNGRIKCLFGTLKAALRGYAIGDIRHLGLSQAQFRYWYNAVRPHQHLGGCAPLQVWQGIDPYRQMPRWFEGWDGRLRGWVLHH